MEAKASSDIQLPPGFRFHPSDEELIVHYLKNKITSNPLPASIIAEIDLCKYNPWELQASPNLFFPMDSPLVAAVAISSPVATSPASHPPAAGREQLHVSDSSSHNSTVPLPLMGTHTSTMIARCHNSKRKGSMRLDDWVLCRVRQKNSIPRSTWEDQNVPSSAPTGFFPRVNGLQDTNINPNVEMIRNYFYNDCPMLPYIFSSQEFPSTERVSSINFPNMEEEGVLSIRNDGTDENLCGMPGQSESGCFSPVQWNPLVQYQEFNHLTLE
ncbi:hypothetical protein Peur_033699 [Populus x canadensis]